jgi:thiamine transport system permease protein
LFLAVFFLMPLAAILRLSVASGGQGLAALADPYLLRVIWFSLWQAALSTALTLAVALPLAFVFARFRFPGRALLRAVATVPFVLPTTVVAAALTALLGPRGIVSGWLAAVGWEPLPPLSGLGAVLLGHVFYNLSIVLRIVGGFWSTLDLRLEQAAQVLGAPPRQVFLAVTLPLLLPPIAAAALLVFIFCFSSFGIALLLGGPRFATVEVEIYRQTTQALRLDVAAALSLVQLGVTLALTVGYTRIQARSAAPLERRAGDDFARPPRSNRERLLVASAVALLGGLVAAPLGALALRSVTSFGSEGGLTLSFYQLLGENTRGSLFFVPPLQALANSLLFALAATSLALVVGVPAAYLLVGARPEGGRQRVAPRVGRLVRPVLDALFTLPLGISSVTLGLGYIVVFGPRGLLREVWLIPVAHALLAVPFVVRSLVPALRTRDIRLREAAYTLGAGPVRALLAVDLPLLLPAVLVGAVFSFTVSLGDYGASLLLASPDTPTVPVVIGRLLGQPGAANYGQALALSTILMLVAVAGFVLLERRRLPGDDAF